MSPSVNNREKYIKDGDDDDSNNVYQSDLVRLVLNLAYLTKAQVDNFTFDREGFERLQRKNAKDY